MSVRFRVLDSIDHRYLDRRGGGLELEPELLLDGREEGHVVDIDGLIRPLQFEIEGTGQACFVEHLAIGTIVGEDPGDLWEGPAASENARSLATTTGAQAARRDVGLSARLVGIVDTSLVTIDCRRPDRRTELTIAPKHHQVVDRPVTHLGVSRQVETLGQHGALALAIAAIVLLARCDNVETLR